MVSRQPDLLRDVLLVGSKDRIRQTRSALEKVGYYDSSRRIDERENGYFHLPITPSAATDLRARESTTDVSDQNVDCITPIFYNGLECYLSRTTLPPSKSAIARFKSPSQSLKSSLQRVLSQLQPLLPEEKVDRLMADLPSSWERHGDLVLLPSQTFTSSEWRQIIARLPDFWETVARGLGCLRLARDSEISRDGFRSSRAVLLVGSDPWVEHVDNGIKYVFDVTRIMFSSGNITEKLRLAELDCHGEVVVDLYAGIGYFTLPYLIHAGSDTVHACEWNPAAVEGLRRGLVANGVLERCVLHEGDCREVCPSGVAHRVNLGLIPSSEGGWATACTALRPDTGGWLHIHGNVAWKHGNRLSNVLEQNPWEQQKEKEEEEEGERGAKDCGEEHNKTKAISLWTDYVLQQIRLLLRDKNRLCDGRRWRVKLGRVGTVKSYAPFVDHMVVDMECRPAEPGME